MLRKILEWNHLHMFVVLARPCDRSTVEVHKRIFENFQGQQGSLEVISVQFVTLTFCFFCYYENVVLPSWKLIENESVIFSKVFFDANACFEGL